MKLSKLEKEILARLKIKKSMLLKEIRAHFGISNKQMCKISLRLRQAKLVVSSATGAYNKWYDKEYADSLGIKPTERKPKRNWCSIATGEQPYLDRMSRIEIFWPKSIVYGG